MTQPVYLTLTAPMTVVGDIHGQFYDLLRIFKQNGVPPDKKYLFLGDYVDRGKKGIEVLCLLYALKLKYPEHIFLIRGNHECASLNRLYGFFDECLRRYNSLAAWNAFVATFNVLPFAAVINERILCIHGGISPLLESVAQIQCIERPLDIPERGLVTDLVWADPVIGLDGFGENSRGIGCGFGVDVLCKFLDNNQLQMLIRAHEMVDGFTIIEGICVTVFSAPYYCGMVNNSGAYLTVSESLVIDFFVCLEAMN